jgi:hypothetical protein
VEQGYGKAAAQIMVIGLEWTGLNAVGDFGSFGRHDTLSFFAERGRFTPPGAKNGPSSLTASFIVYLFFLVVKKKLTNFVGKNDRPPPVYSFFAENGILLSQLWNLKI